MQNMSKKNKPNNSGFSRSRKYLNRVIEIYEECEQEEREPGRIELGKIILNLGLCLKALA